MRRVMLEMPWLAVGRLPVVTPFPAARPSPAPQDPSLHPPSQRRRRSTNNTDTRMLRGATLGSTLPRRPHLHRVGVYTLAKTTPPRKLHARQPTSRVQSWCRLRTSSGSRHCSLRVLQPVVSEHAASPHAPSAGTSAADIQTRRALMASRVKRIGASSGLALFGGHHLS